MSENEQEERKIKQASRHIEISFYAVWGMVILLVALFELEWLPVGALEAQARSVYYLQTVGVLMALALIPTSLKYFHVQVQKLHGQVDRAKVLRRYLVLSYLRIGGLALPILFNLVLYYLSLNKAPGFMALITLLATIFCIPSEQRLKYELEWDQKAVPQKQSDAK